MLQTVYIEVLNKIYSRIEFIIDIWNDMIGQEGYDSTGRICKDRKDMIGQEGYVRTEGYDRTGRL